jgi:hypothetical protein
VIAGCQPGRRYLVGSEPAEGDDGIDPLRQMPEMPDTGEQDAGVVRVSREGMSPGVARVVVNRFEGPAGRVGLAGAGGEQPESDEVTGPKPRPAVQNPLPLQGNGRCSPPRPEEPAGNGSHGIGVIASAYGGL